MTEFAREVDRGVPGALNPGEEVLWTGHCLSRLGQQRKARPLSKWLLLLFVPLSGLGILLVIEGLEERKFGAVFGGGVLLIVGGTAMYTLIREYFRDGKMYCRKQTVYVLTDQRAFVLKHCRTTAPMRSIVWRYVDLVRAEAVRTDGRGTVKFWRWDPVAQQWETVLQFHQVGNAAHVAEWGQSARAANLGGDGE